MGSWQCRGDWRQRGLGWMEARPWASPAVGVRKMGVSAHRRPRRRGQGAGRETGGKPPRSQVQKEAEQYN